MPSSFSVTKTQIKTKCYFILAKLNKWISTTNVDAYSGKWEPNTLLVGAQPGLPVWKTTRITYGNSVMYVDHKSTIPFLGAY